MPTALAMRHPAKPQKIIKASSNIGMSRVGNPGGLFNSTCQIRLSKIGKLVTITKTRVAWIKDMARILPPASAPKTNMSCNPPGIAA